MAPEVIKQMESIKNSKFENSKYLSFMKQLNSGVIEISGNELKTNEDKLKEFEINEEIKQAERMEWDKSVKIEAFEDNFNGDTEFSEASELFRRMWNEGEINDDELGKL